MKLYIPVILALFLGACAQDLGGITKVDASFTPEGLPQFEYDSGKEAGALAMTYTKTKDGGITVEVTAGDVKAFEGQAIQAERIKAQTEAIANVIRDTLPDILKTALCAAGVASSC